MKGERIEALDGLRGIAALVVFFGHVIAMLPRARVPEALWYSPLHASWDGTAAVMLFFVLSGFVLALPFVGAAARPLELRRYWVKRVLRIYPAWWVALGVSVALLRCTQAEPPLVGVSQWFNHFWHALPTPRDLFAHALLVGPGFDTTRIDCVIWSLVVEMRLSLIYPAVVIVLARARTFELVIFAAITVALAAFVGTLTYLPVFLLGGIVARERRRLFALARSLPTAAACAVAVVSLVLFDVRFALGPTRLPYRAADYAIAVGSALMIVLVAARPLAARALSSPPIAFLGAVSYSFYLLHFPLLLAMAHLLPSPWLAPPLALASALVLSALVHRAVEKPFIALGRRAC